MGGKISTWGTYSANGNYTWKHTGVLKGSKDQLCAGKVSGWNN